MKMYSLKDPEGFETALKHMSRVIENFDNKDKNVQFIMGVADVVVNGVFYQIHLVYEADEERFVGKGAIETREWEEKK